MKARCAHSAVESAINALEVHGLDVCTDHGIDGLKRYVALAVVARNIQRIGAILWKKEQQREQKKEICRFRPAIQTSGIEKHENVSLMGLILRIMESARPKIEGIHVFISEG